MTKEEKAYREWISKHPCHACKNPGVEHEDGVRRNDPAHIVSKGSGGKYIGNIIPLCRSCHNLSHVIGWERFIEKFRCEVWMAGIAYEREYESTRDHTKEKRIQAPA